MMSPAVATPGRNGMLSAATASLSVSPGETMNFAQGERVVLKLSQNRPAAFRA
jgi:hypothetical protein